MTVPTVTEGDEPAAAEPAAAPTTPPEIFRQAVESPSNTDVRLEVRVEP